MSNLLLPSNVPNVPLVWNPRMPGGMRDGLDAALLGEHSGSDYAHDSSGHDRNGRYDRSANYGWMWSNFLGRWTHGFDAAQNDLITLGEPTFWLANENQFSLSLWGRRPSSLYAGLIARDGNERTSPIREWFLAGQTSQRLHLRLYQTNGTARNIYTANDAWPLNEWMHICVTVDGPNSAVSLYLDGVYQDFTPASWDGTVKNTNASDQWIGRTYNTSYDFTGQLADVLLHGRVVTPPEIQWLANPANHLRVPWRRKSWLVGGAEAVTPLTITGAALNLESPYEVDDPVDTAEAAGGTPPYSYAITAQAADVGVLKVTGTLNPDATGIYTKNGTYNRGAAYERADGSYWIWHWRDNWWVISTGKGVLSPHWEGYGLLGDYEPVAGGATGTATVANATPFAINSSTGAITIADPDPLIVGHVWTITVQVTDNASATASDDWEVTLVSAEATIEATLSESLAAGDSLVAALSALAATSEGASLGDATEASATLRPTEADGATLGDSQEAATTGRPATSDEAALGDSLAASKTTSGTTSDAALLGDSQAAEATLRRSLVDGMIAGEQWAVRFTRAATIADGSLLSDSFEALVLTTIQAALSEGTQAGSAFAAAMLAYGAITEGIRTSDAYAAVVAAVASMADSATLGDVFVADLAHYVRGPYRVAAAEAYSPRLAAGQTYAPAMAAGQVYSPGIVAGQVV